MAGFPKVQLADKAKKPRAGIPLALQKDKIQAGIIKTYGNLSRVADSLGCSRNALRNYINSDEELKATLADARERTGDLLEDTAINQAVNGSATMTMFLLKARHRDRGYSFEPSNEAENIARTAFEFIANRSKNPVDQSHT